MGPEAGPVGQDARRPWTIRVLEGPAVPGPHGIRKLILGAIHAPAPQIGQNQTVRCAH